MKQLTQYMDECLTQKNNVNEGVFFDIHAKRIVKDLTELLEKYDITITASHRGLEIENNQERGDKIVLPNLINKKTLDNFMKQMKALTKPMKMSINSGKTGYIPTEDDIIGVVK